VPQPRGLAWAARALAVALSIGGHKRRHCELEHLRIACGHSAGATIQRRFVVVRFLAWSESRHFSREGSIASFGAH